jgi:hypothetical protein
LGAGERAADGGFARAGRPDDDDDHIAILDRPMNVA